MIKDPVTHVFRIAFIRKFDPLEDILRDFFVVVMEHDLLGPAKPMNRFLAYERNPHK